jgi:hypothetical protein
LTGISGGHFGRATGAEAAMTGAARTVRKGGPAAVLLAVLLAAAGCTYQGPAGSYLGQRLTFLSYLNGDDIRAVCEPGAPNRYRFVYVADYDRQARGYEVIPTPEGALLRQQVDRGLLVNGIRLDRLFEAGAPTRAEARLTPAELDDLEQAMFASGVFAPPPVGLRLDSRGFFWIVTGCYRGAYVLTGYRYPSERFEQIRFDEALFSHDRLDAPIRRPTPSDIPVPPTGCSRQLREGGSCFSVEVGRDGLVGAWTID